MTAAIDPTAPTTSPWPNTGIVPPWLQQFPTVPPRTVSASERTAVHAGQPAGDTNHDTPERG